MNFPQTARFQDAAAKLRFETGALIDDGKDKSLMAPDQFMQTTRVRIQLR
jgi:hypothetical protein